MNVINYMKSNKVFSICMLLYIIITFPLMFNHTPWFDEAHAWILAKFINFSNWSDIVKSEGHPVVWYLMLTPFAKTNLQNLYPYPMLVINYLFCLTAIVIMWLKSPFNNFFKIAITFSFMFLQYFPIVARNYSMGVLGLFWLAAYYKQMTRKPIMYAAIVALTLQTHAICAIGASWFGILLLYNLLKENSDKKNVLFSALIMIGSVIFFAYPFMNGYGDETYRMFSSPGIIHLLYFIFAWHGLVGLLYLIIFFYILIKNNLKSKLFLIYTTTLLAILFLCFYAGFAQHFIFFFLYLIMAFWINDIQSSDKNFNKIYIVLSILILLPINAYFQSHFFWDNELNLRQVVYDIKSQKYISPDNPLLIDIRFYPIIPYLNEYRIYDTCREGEIDISHTLYCPQKIVPSALKNKYIYYLTGNAIDGIMPVYNYNNVLFIYRKKG